MSQHYIGFSPTAGRVAVERPLLTSLPGAIVYDADTLLYPVGVEVADEWMRDNEEEAAA